jgi:hypothetical protein
MGPVSFGAALIAAPKSLNGSLDVTLIDLEQTDVRFCALGHRASCFTSWDTGRHVCRVGIPELDFGSFCDLCGHLFFSNITLRHSLL